MEVSSLFEMYFGTKTFVRYSEMSVVRRYPLHRGVRCSDVSAVRRCPLFRGVR